METNEQIRKYKEEVKYLLNLLKLAYQERDEARDQLQKLLNKLMPSSPTTELQPMIPHHPQPESPLMIAAAKANSSITESSSLSDTLHGSSPLDPFIDAVTSPEFSSINMADSGSNLGILNHPYVAKIDASATVIDKLVEGKTLPQKGKLLEAVMESGPLLQTLFVAGPLPRWRNPPTVQFKIPPVSIQGCDSKTANQKPSANPSRTMVQKRLNPGQMSRGSNQLCSAAMLNFAGSGSASGLSNSQLFSTGAGFYSQITAGKRQRFN